MHNSEKKHKCCSVFTLQLRSLIFDQYLTESESHRSQGEHRSQAAGAVKSISSVCRFDCGAAARTPIAAITHGGVCYRAANTTDDIHGGAIVVSSAHQIHRSKHVCALKATQGAAALSDCR